MPSKLTSERDQTKDITDDMEQTQNSNLSSNEESFVSSASKSISKTKGRTNTTSKHNNDKWNSIQNKDVPDENENCDSFVSIFRFYWEIDILIDK